MDQNQQVAEVKSQVPAAYFPTESDWKIMVNFGTSALRSGLLPVGVKTAESAAIIALKGRELGIPFMQALSHIHIIGGKPAMSAELLQALARKNLPGLVINILQSDDKIAEIEFIRPEKGAKPFRIAFTITDAERAKLLGKDVWKQYPGAMLYSRAVSAGLRRVCPEALMGVSYTPEELGANVNQEGNVIETTGKAVSYPEIKTPAESDPLVLKGLVDRQKNLNKIMALSSEFQISSGYLIGVMKEKFKKSSSKDLTDQEVEELLKMIDPQSISQQAEKSLSAESSQQEQLPPWDKDL
jgi:hypothetical protein